MGKASQHAQELMGWGEHRCCSTGEMAASDIWAAEEWDRSSLTDKPLTRCQATGRALPVWVGDAASGGLAGFACDLGVLQSSAKPGEHVHGADRCHGAYVEEDLAAVPWVWEASSWLSLGEQS